MALPVKPDGRCIHLGDDNQCQIYERRPRVCQQFNCLYGYCLGRTRHGFFLQDNPDVVTLLETTYPEYTHNARIEQAKKPEI